jgi:hypothetical protein
MRHVNNIDVLNFIIILYINLCIKRFINIFLIFSKHKINPFYKMTIIYLLFNNEGTNYHPYFVLIF